MVQSLLEQGGQSSSISVNLVKTKKSISDLTSSRKKEIEKTADYIQNYDYENPESVYYGLKNINIKPPRFISEEKITVDNYQFVKFEYYSGSQGPNPYILQYYTLTPQENILIFSTESTNPENQKSPSNGIDEREKIKILVESTFKFLN